MKHGDVASPLQLSSLHTEDISSSASLSQSAMVNSTCRSHNSGTKPKLPVKPKKMTSIDPLQESNSSFGSASYACSRNTSTSCAGEDQPSDLWIQKQFHNSSDVDHVTETTVITTASLVLSPFPDSSENSAGYLRSNGTDTPLSDYENSTPPSPSQGILSKSSSASSNSSFQVRPFSRSVHSLSSTSLSSATYPFFQPVEFASSNNYLFHTSDCEDQSDFVPSNFSRSLHGYQATPSPVLSRPSSPLPPTPSPNFSRTPSPNRSRRRVDRANSSEPSRTNSVPGSPQFSRSLNSSRETSPLTLRPSSYTRPLSPNPPTISPGSSAIHLARNMQLGGLRHTSPSRILRSQPSSPQSRPRSTMFHQAVQAPLSQQQISMRSPSPLNTNRNISLRSPPSPTRVSAGPSNSSSPRRTPLSSRSPVISRPPSPLNASRHHALLLPSARPVRSQSQPPGSHRLHSRTR